METKIKYKLTSIAFPSRTPQIVDQAAYDRLKQLNKLRNFTVETIKVKQSPLPEELKQIKKT